MKTNRLVLSVLVSFVIGLGVACAKQERVDLVNGVPPVSGSMASIARTLDEMSKLPEGERAAYLERTWPNLSRDVVYFLRRLGKITPDQKVRHVDFRFGSLENVRAESRDGNRYGYFRNQLVALVNVEGASKPMAVIVQCLNGTFATEDELGRLQQVGSHTPIEQFRIGYREGLIHHVDFPTAIHMAERFNLPLYRGRKMDAKHRITPAEARRLESTVDRLQVTVYVVEGDEFDLARMTFQPSPLRAKMS